MGDAQSAFACYVCGRPATSYYNVAANAAASVPSQMKPVCDKHNVLGVPFQGRAEVDLTVVRAELASALARAAAAERRVVAARKAITELRVVLNSPEMRAPFNLADLHGQTISADTAAWVVAAWDAVDAALALDAGQQGANDA